MKHLVRDQPRQFTNRLFNTFPQGKSFLLLCLSLSVVLGLLVRLPYFFKYDFALNDGALFVQMAEAIRDNSYILPETVEYNQTELPFAYPPLAFYLVAFLTDLFRKNMGVPPYDILDVVRYMPLSFNILSICVFTLLASRLIKNKLILLYTSLFFPLIPRSYEWLIMGGGVTRSVGFFFALMAIYQGVRLASPSENRLVSSLAQHSYGPQNRTLLKQPVGSFILCSLFLSMAALSHLEWGITGAVTVSLLTLSKQFNKRSLLLVATLGIVVLALTAPWWITVIARHGLDPFMAASKTSEWDRFRFQNLFILSIKIFDDGLGAPLSVLAIIGWLLCVARRDWFLPIWLIAIYLTTPRHGPTAGAMPLAILASIGLAQFLMPMLVQVVRFNYPPIVWSRLFGRKTFFRRLLPNPLVASCVIPVVLLLVLTQASYVKRTPLIALTKSERSAMTWVKNHTSPESKFVLLSRSLSWEEDRVAEWFPVLSDRKSLTTAQGLEWMPGNAFRSKVGQIAGLKRHQALRRDELYRFIESRYDSFQYIGAFIPGIKLSYGNFIESGRYRVAYNNKSVLVFERI